MKFFYCFLIAFLYVFSIQTVLAMQEGGGSDADVSGQEGDSSISKKKIDRLKKEKGKRKKRKYKIKSHTILTADDLDEDLAGDEDLEVGNFSTLNNYHISELFKRTSYSFSLKRQQELRKLMPKTLQQNPQLVGTARSALRRTRSNEDVLETVQQANEFFGPLVEQLLDLKDTKIGKQKKTIKVKGDREKTILSGGGVAFLAQTVAMIIILILRFTEC